MTTTFSHETDEELTRKLIAVLEARGYRVTKPETAITVGELARQLGRNTNSVSRSLVRPSCPIFASTRSGTGRILSLEPSEKLLKYLKSK